MHEPPLREQDTLFFCGRTSLEAMRVKTERKQTIGEKLPLVEIMRDRGSTDIEGAFPGLLGGGA